MQIPFEYLSRPDFTPGWKMDDHADSIIWSDVFRSRNIAKWTDDIVHRNRRRHETDGAVAQDGYEKGVHIIEFNWKQHERGSHAGLIAFAAFRLIYIDYRCWCDFFRGPTRFKCY